MGIYFFKRCVEFLQLTNKLQQVLIKCLDNFMAQVVDITVVKRYKKPRDISSRMQIEWYTTINICLPSTSNYEIKKNVDASHRNIGDNNPEKKN
jgi:hypothetical protein